MEIRMEAISNGFEVRFETHTLNHYTAFYKTEKRALDAIHRAVDRYWRKGEF